MVHSLYPQNLTFFIFVQQQKQQNRKNEQEQKPRKDDIRVDNLGPSLNEITDGNLKIFYKPWKEEVPIMVDDYDERHRKLESKQQLNYDAW